MLSPLPPLPQELWNNITTYLLPSSASNASIVFNFDSTAYDRVWTAVFKSVNWLESDNAKYANIALIGADLDILSGITKDRTQPRLVLAAFDRYGDLQYKEELLHLSLRGEFQSKNLMLAISRLDVPKVLGEDFCYLFSCSKKEMQTKFCYWRDPAKKIRTLGAQNIRGISRSITQLQNLRPIFLLNLDILTQFPLENSEHDSCRRSSRVPVQFIFRCFGGPSFWTGCPPLVNVILDKAVEQSQQEHAFQGFIFKDIKYKKYHRQNTDWSSIAEIESGQKCAVIETL